VHCIGGAEGLELEFKDNPLPLSTYRLVHLSCRPILYAMKGIYLQKTGAIDAPHLYELLSPVDRLEKEVESYMYSDTPIHYCIYYILVLHLKVFQRGIFFFVVLRIALLSVVVTGDQSGMLPTARPPDGCTSARQPVS